LKTKIRAFIVVFFMLVSFSGLAQFSFNVTKTDETCTGNATLTFQLTNTNAQASYTFVIYKLPNTTTPLLVTTSTYVEFLANGTYIIEAIENLNGTTTVQTQQVTIQNLIVPLTYYIIETPTNCGITIEVITIEGNPVSYEIFSGIPTYPLQESNIFTGLQHNVTYQIRIYDECGEGYVRTHTIEEEPLNNLEIWNIENELIDCNTIRAHYSANSALPVSNLELTCTFTFPDLTQTSFTNTVNIPQGETNDVFYIDFPYYSQEEVAFSISYFHCEPVTIDSEFMFLYFDLGENECGFVYFTLYLEGLLYPYKVEFTQSPEGFNPLDYNENHPFHSQEHIAYGIIDNPMPLGEYAITVTDDCGFEREFEFILEYTTDTPIKGAGNNGCEAFGAYFLIKFPTDRTIVTAQIIDGPPESAPFPINIDEYITEDGDLWVQDYPPGTYTVIFTDSCGFEYEEEIEIPEQSLQEFLGTSFIACEDQHGTLRMSSQNGKVVEAIIVAAPEGFPYSLPYDAASHITTNGVLFFPSLPSGEYQIQSEDSCGYSQLKTMTVAGEKDMGYVEKQCNIVDVFVGEYQPLLSPWGESYWLQYYSENTGEWGHPYTEVLYTDQTVPNADNSMQLIYNPNTVPPRYELFNVGVFGDFRIVKVFPIVLSDSPYQTGQCINAFYYEFTYSMDLTITNAYRIICEGPNNNLQNVFIQAEGIEPLNYFIIQKDGQPFSVDNGTNNVFTDLEPGIYTFQVTDPCGNLRNRIFDLSDIELMVANGPTDDLPGCSNPETGLYELYLPDRNIYLVASTLSLEYFNFSYHYSYDDAYNDSNPLPDSYSAQPGIYTIYVRIENNLIDGCFNIAYFDLVVVGSPNIELLQTDYSLCEDQESIIIDLDGLFDNYLWFDGSTQSSIEITQGGTYTATVSNQVGETTCTAEITFTVFASSAPIIEDIAINDWTTSNNTITVDVSGSGNYVYSLNGVYYQQSNVFSGLQTGYYTIFVKDLNGCGETVSEALVLNYPRYFTPNGDGIHDYWRIPLSSLEPDMTISIFDRYGKLIKVFKGDELGWDGTFNGKKLHSTDYWFTVERKNGVIKKGHFSMKR
jgi:gliding motility-associated-like protein